jgi:ribosomal protein S18 acetylase RimI-like enzyme
VSPRVWLAGPGEAETVARLLVEFRDWYGRDWPSERAFLAGIEKLMEDPATDYLLGAPDEDSPPAGVAQLRYRYGIWLAGTDCWLEDLYVSEQARGSGLGAALVRGAIERARERDCRRVELDVDRTNEAAQRLYRGLGFEDKGEGTDFLRLRLAQDP